MNPLESPAPHLRPAFSPITPDDHAGQVWILTILAVIYTITSLIVRGYIKWNLFWLDDYLLALATAVHLTQAGAVFYGLTHGLAKFNSITTEHQWALSGRAFLAAEVLAVIALSLAKCSVWALLLRIFVADGAFNDWRVKTCLGFVCLGVSWGIISIVGIVIACDPDFMLSPGHTDQCAGQYTRWKALTALDAGTEVLGCLLPAALVWSLNMAARSKFHVLLAFSFRLPLAALSVLHLRCARHLVRSPEPLFAATDPLLAQQAMLAWSLLSATIPNVKSFMRVFNFAMGMGGASDARGAASGLAWTPPAERPILLRAYGPRTAPRDEDEEAGVEEMDGPCRRKEGGSAESDRGAAEDEDEELSLGRSDSREMIIRKDVQARVPDARRGSGV